MNEDFGDILNKFSDILKEKNINLNDIGNNNKTEQSTIPEPTDNSNFDIDIETILKIKDIISKMNKNQNSTRNKLLYSLKPYLETTKQEKLDSYIKIANLLSVLEEMDLGLSFLENKKGYDFILIITLFLLIF